MGTCVQLIACFIVAFVQGFVVGWKLALVLLGIVPALVGAALIASKVWTTNAGYINQFKIPKTKTVIFFWKL